MTERKAVHTDLKILAKTFDVLPSELEAALGSLAVLAFEPGAVILEEGGTGTDVYVVIKGKMSVLQSRWVFLKKEVAQLVPGNLFGEIGFLVAARRSASVVAKEQCEVARITINDFKLLLTHHPELQARIEEMARRRLYSLSASSRS
ncbi:MAG: cyclic nucleotide-binding domain-containing protein [Elusimicrobia bacterium]|nr:cyclic nucleotide-binding domain-containing protein [Elusimicrobiota bacterium]